MYFSDHITIVNKLVNSTRLFANNQRATQVYERHKSSTHFSPLRENVNKSKLTFTLAHYEGAIHM